MSQLPLVLIVLNIDCFNFTYRHYTFCTLAIVPFGFSYFHTWDNSVHALTCMVFLLSHQLKHIDVSLLIMTLMFFCLIVIIKGSFFLEAIGNCFPHKHTATIKLSDLFTHFFNQMQDTELSNTIELPVGRHRLVHNLISSVQEGF